MAHCINIKHPQYKRLFTQSKNKWSNDLQSNEKELKARIALWQIKNNSDEFPSLSDIESEINIKETSNQEGELLFKIDTIKREIKNRITDKSLVNDIYSVLKNINIIGSENFTPYVNSSKFINSKNFENFNEYTNDEKQIARNNFLNIFNSLFNNREKEEFYNWAKTKSDKSFIDTFIEVLNDYILTDGVYKTDNVSINNKLSLFNNTSNEIINNYISLRSIFWKDQFKIERKDPYYTKELDNNIKLINENEKNISLISDKNKKKYFNNNNIIKSSDFLDNIMKNSKSDLLKVLKSKISNNDVDIELVDTLYFEKNDKSQKTSSAYYDNKLNKIFISKSGNNIPTITHEIIHALTNNYLNSKNNELIKDFNNIYNYVRANDYLFSNKYPLYSIDEFMVGVFNDPIFMKELSKLAPLNRESKYNNVFTELWNKILEFLGITNENKNAWEESFKIASNILNDINNVNKYDININNDIVYSPPISSGSKISRMKKLRDVFSMQEIKERATTITTLFSDIINYYQGLEEYKYLDRQEVIKTITPSTIFDEVKLELEGTLEDFKDELENTSNNLRKEQLNSYINSLNKVLDNDNYNNLCLYALGEIGKLEGITFNNKNYNQKQENDYGQSILTELAEDFDFGEEKILDSWQKNYKFTSVSDSLTQKIKAVLRFIPQITKDNIKVIDSLGFQKRLDSSITHNVLLKGLENMLESKDMIPMLKDLSKSKPWVNDIINKLIDKDGKIKDNELFSQFYQTYRKDSVTFSIVKTTENSDGTLKYSTTNINDINTINYFINEWKTNIEENIVLSEENSIYNNGINKNNAINNIQNIIKLENEWKSVKTKGTKDQIRKNKELYIVSNLNKIKSLLEGIGISSDEKVLDNILRDSLVEFEFGEVYSFNLDSIFDNIKNINNWAKNNNDIAKLFENNNNNYKVLSKLFLENQDNIIESYVHENGKGYYSHLNPSYIGKLIKQLNNSSNNITKFNEFINKEFKQYEGTLYNAETNKFTISWLNDLVDEVDEQGNIIIDNSKNRKILDHKVQLNFNKTDYDSLDPLNYSLSLMTEYFSNKSTAWFRIPILSDAPSSEFLKFNKITDLNFKDNITNKLLDLFFYEYNRIKLVKSMNDSNTNKITNFNDRGTKFVFMPFINEHINEIEELYKQDENLAISKIKEIIKNNLDIKSKENMDYFKTLGLLEVNKRGDYIYLKDFGINKDNINNKFDEYFYNDYLATANIIQLTTTDLALYKDVSVFQKRNKQIHAPGTALNTLAEYNGERIGKENETTIYLADEEVKSNILPQIESVILENNNLSNIEKANIITAYGSNNIIEYKNDNGTFINIISSELHDKEIGFYKVEGNNFNKITKEEYLNNKKDSKEKEYYLVKDNNNYAYVPTKLINVTDAQAYRSLRSYKSIVAMSTGWNDKLEHAYQNLMQGKWDIKDYNTLFQVIKPFMYTQHAVNSGNKEGTKIKVPVQNKNSEALLLPIFGITKGDSRIKAVTQLMDQYDVDVIQFESAVKVGKQGVLDINGFDNRKDILNYVLNNKSSWQTLSYEDYKIQQPIPEHLIDHEQLIGTQIRKLIMADISEKAKFKLGNKKLSKKDIIKLYQDTNIENILQSYLKIKDEFSDINKLQEIIENEIFTNDRYSKDLLNACQLDENNQFVLPLHEPSQSSRIQQLLNSVWKSRITKQKIKGGKAVQITSYGLSNDLNIVFNKDGSIKHYECYLPWWSKEVGRNLIDKETGEIDYNYIKDTSPEILDMVAYRIPTEDKYSMIPLKVKGFLPRNAGSNIMLPKEITTITGSDFDVDSMYIMMKEFIYNSKDNKFEVLNYIDNDGNIKDPKDLNVKQRNNLLIDIILSILTNKDTTEKMLNPGNFDTQKRTARLLSLLELGYEYNDISNKSLDELTSILDKNEKSSLDILSVSSQIKLHQQNMTASKLIGIFANHNANHALLQFTDIKLSKKKIVDRNNKLIGELPKIILNGKSLEELNKISIEENGNSRFISKTLAGYLAASVDAVKDPVLNFMNLNTYTADPAMLLSRLGYTTDEVGIFLKQPVIIEIINAYNKNSRKGLSKTDAIIKVKKEYEDKINKLGLPKFISKNDPLYINKLADNITLNSKLNKLNFVKEEEKNRLIQEIGHSNINDFYISQLEVLNMFNNVMDVSQKLADLVSSLRADTQGGGAGASIAQTIIKDRKVDKNINNSLSKHKRLENSNIIHKNLSNITDIEELRNKFRENPIGFSQAFHTLGLEATKEQFGKYFPHYNNYFDYIINIIEENTKNQTLNEKELNLIYNDFYAYYLSQYDNFNSDNASKFINDFSKEFIEYVQKNPELKELTFINNIKYIKPTQKNPIGKLKFINVGKLNSTTRDEVISEWESLLYGDQKHKQLAIDLFKYCFYCNGFNFGNDSFIHLAPTELKLNIDNYVSGLNQLITKKVEKEGIFNYDTLDTFIEQFYKNHLYNRNLVPEMNSIDENEFLNNNEVLDNINIKVILEDNKNIEFIKNNEDGLDVIPYFVKKINENEYYYQLDINNSKYNEKEVIANYKRIEPLGMRGNFLEYSYGNDKYSTAINTNIPLEDNNIGFSDMTYNDNNYMDSFMNLDELNNPRQDDGEFSWSNIVRDDINEILMDSANNSKEVEEVKNKCK